MPTYVTPGVYFEPLDVAARGVTALRTDIAAFVGIAERGPLNTPVKVTTWEQFQTTFGNFTGVGYLAYTAKAFFENGGREMYAVRVAAPLASTRSDGPQPAGGSSSTVESVTGFAPGAAVTVRQSLVTHTAAVPQPADRGSSLVNDVAGFTAGTKARITQTLPSPLRSYGMVAISDPALNLITWKEPLDAAYDLTQPIQFDTDYLADYLLAGVDLAAKRLDWAFPLDAHFAPNVPTAPIFFDTGASPAAGDLWDEEGKPTVRVEASSPGTWGDKVSVRVAREHRAATRTAPVPQPSPRLSSRVESVTGFTVGSLVKVFQEKPVPLERYAIVQATDPARTALLWTAALDPAFDLTQPIDFESVEFGLTVYQNARVREVFSGLSLVPEHPRYIGKDLEVVNGVSSLIAVRDVGSLAPFPARLPDPQAFNLARGLLPLTGGRDGLAALKLTDFTGEPGADDKLGLRALEDVDEVAIVAVPDILIRPLPPVLTDTPPAPEPNPCLPICGPADPPSVPLPAPPIEQPPIFNDETVAAVQQALVQHCETLRDRIAVLDPPLQPGQADLVDLGEIVAWRQRFDSKYAALYYPWLLVYDPLRLGGEVVRAIPPSGHVAGIFARTDLREGVHKAPANEVVYWAQAPVLEIGAEEQGILNPAGVNCIRTFPGRGLRVYGARTVSSDPDWRYVNVRRLLMMVEEAVEDSLQWAAFEPNSYDLRRTIRLAITGFLEALWEAGALAGTKVDEAFFVRCDDTNNPPSEADAGRLIVDVGVAPAIPAEFVVFRIGRTEAELLITE
jgi:phage tail sheath protein FI